MDSDEASTPKKRKSTSKKQPKTPKKDSKANIALKLFGAPIFRNEDGKHNTYYKCSLCKRDLCGNNVANLASHILHKHETDYVKHFGPIDDPIEVKR